MPQAAQSLTPGHSLIFMARAAAQAVEAVLADAAARVRERVVLEGRPTWSPDWPMLRLARVLRKHLPQARAASNDHKGGTPQSFQAALDRYVSNKKLIEAASAASGVAPIFVWQPVPSYKHDGRRYYERFHDSVPWRLWSLDAYGPVYEQVEDLAGAGQLGGNFLFCGSVTQGLDEVLYIDLVHYHPRLSQMVAECIVSQIRERSLLPLAAAATADARTAQASSRRTP